MGVALNIVILEDRPADLEMVLHELRRAGFKLNWRQADNEADFVASLDSPPDIILADYSLPQWDAPAALRAVHERGLDIPLIMISGTVGEDVAVECIRLGAVDYLLKDRLARLGSAVTSALENKRQRVAKEQAEEQLRRSEATLRNAQRVARVGSWAWNVKTNQLVWSDEMFHIFGIEKEDFSGSLQDVIARAIHPDDRFKVDQSKLSVINENKPVPLEYRVIWPDQSIHVVWAEAGELVIDEIGNPALLTGIAQDITEHKRTEAALIASETRYRRLFEAAKDGILILEVGSGKIVDVNPFLLDLMGYSQGEILGKELWEIGFFKDIIASHAAFLELKDKRYIRYEDLPLETKDGQRLDVEFVGNVYEVNGTQVIQCNIRDITARKQAQALQQQQHQYLEFLQETSLELVSQFDLDHLLENIVRRAGDLVGTTSGFLDLIEPETGQLLPMIGLGTLVESLNYVVQPGQGLTGKVLQTGKPLVVNNYDDWTGHLDGFPNHLLRSAIGVPLLADSQVLGVLGLAYDTTTDCTFSPEVIAILEQFAHLASIAIKNARLFSRVQQELTERKRAETDLEKQYRALRFLHEIAVEIGGELELSALLHNIMMRAVELMQANRGGGIYLYVAEENILRMVEGAGINQDRVGCTVALNEGVAGRVFQTTRPVIIEDYTHWAEHSTILVASPPSTVMGIPLLNKGQAIGVITLIADSSQRTFTEEDMLLTEMFAAQANIAIQNAQLYGKAQQELTERKRAENAEHDQRVLAEALRDTAASLISALDRDAVMNTILENLSRVLPHDAANIMLIEGDEAYVVYWRGYRPTNVDPLRNFHVPLATPNLQKMVITQAPLLVSHIDQVSDWMHQPYMECVKSYIAAPICSHDTVIGFLSADSDVPNFFTEDHAQRLQAFADQASIAIEHAQLYEEIQRYAAVLEQRVEKRTAQLNHVKERMEAIFNGSSDVMIMCRRDGTIDQVNPAFHTIFKIKADDVHNQSLIMLVVPEHTATMEQSFVAVLETQQPQRLEVIARGAEGTSFDADIVLSPVVGSDDQLFGVICSVRDITVRKKMEVQLRQILTHEMELSELKSRYVSMAAHDLRNPLAIILSAIDIIHHYSDRLTIEQKQSTYDRIRANIKVMVDMLDDILTIGQVESGKLVFEPAPIDTVAFCQNLVAEARQTVRTTQNIEFSSQGNCGTIYLDAKLLRHMLGNLLSNALKYSPEESTVTFTADCAPGQITFRIQDHGIGIPEADRSRLFETFHRASNVRQIHGTGLGLAIVKQSVELHGGTISFESEEGVGTTFIIVLPVIGLERSG